MRERIHHGGANKGGISTRNSEKARIIFSGRRLSYPFIPSITTSFDPFCLQTILGVTRKNFDECMCFVCHLNDLDSSDFMLEIQ